MSLSPREYAPNPYVAYAWVEISGVGITLENGRPQRLQGFQYHMIGGTGGNRVTVNIFDKDETKVESLITSSQDRIMSIRFGYTTGIKSKVLTFTIVNYKPEFAIGGTQITIEGISTPYGPEDRQKSRSFPGDAGKEEMKIHEIVEYIAGENNWSVEFDKTKSVKDNHDLEKSGLMEAHFSQNKMRDAQFIQEVLAPRAIRESDKTADYRVFFEDTSPPKLHFHPPRLDQGPFKTYIYRKNKMSEVISFSPDFNGQVNLKLGAGIAACPYIDTQTGKFEEKYIWNGNTTEKTVLGGPLSVETKPDEEDYSIVESRPVRDEDHAEIAARSRWFTAYHSVFGAQLSVVGDPTLVPHKVIQINVALKDGSFHYSSGLYFIQDLTHEINGGTYTTNMTLIRQGYKSYGGVSGDKAMGKINS